MSGHRFSSAKIEYSSRSLHSEGSLCNRAFHNELREIRIAEGARNAFFSQEEVHDSNEIFHRIIKPFAQVRTVSCRHALAVHRGCAPWCCHNVYTTIRSAAACIQPGKFYETSNTCDASSRTTGATTSRFYEVWKFQKLTGSPRIGPSLNYIQFKLHTLSDRSCRSAQAPEAKNYAAIVALTPPRLPLRFQASRTK
eukprot:1187249-Prorocentrum_minimum.AAC.4